MSDKPIFTLTNTELVSAIDRSWVLCRTVSVGEGVHPPTLEHYKKLLAEQHRRAIERTQP